MYLYGCAPKSSLTRGSRPLGLLSHGFLCSAWVLGARLIWGLLDLDGSPWVSVSAHPWSCPSGVAVSWCDHSKAHHCDKHHDDLEREKWLLPRFHSFLRFFFFEGLPHTTLAKPLIILPAHSSCQPLFSTPNAPISCNVGKKELLSPCVQCQPMLGSGGKNPESLSSWNLQANDLRILSDALKIIPPL